MDLALALWKHRADGRRLLWDIQHAPSLRPLLSYSESLAHRRLAAAALDRFETEAMPRLADLPRQVIHNDLNPHNVLQS
ncbi:aminoglycoside phosphotransferase, partial [Pseudomonas aeruginosa]|uniref:phosphotransferase n=1 Tax=Pseudomonas aeruginosa TaxID=287 RepID=UPI0039F52870|nr:aminoglycoside phosphotransferase [Pseudomonas aeruginosa]